MKDLKRRPLLQDMAPEIRIAKEELWIAIEKASERRFADYIAASRIDGGVVLTGEEQVTPAVPAHVLAVLAEQKKEFWMIPNSSLRLLI